MSTASTTVVLPYVAELDLAELWDGFTVPPGQHDLWGTFRPAGSMQQEFLHYLRSLVSDPESVDAIQFCDDCGEPDWGVSLTRTGDGNEVCDSCLEDYGTCQACEEYYSPRHLNETLNDTDVCDDCLSSYYTYCEDCEGYYPDEASYEHDHDDDSGCCESPQLSFRVRNDGEAPLANDTRASLTLPAGVISDTGMKEIRKCLRQAGEKAGRDDMMGYYYLAGEGGLDEVGNQWQTRTGNFTKRLSRHAYQSHGVKLSPGVMSEVGNIARDHSNAVDVRIEVTRDLNRPASDFYHEDSCWWQSYSESRCALKTNGGFGLRSFDRYGSVSGRAWVMPLRKDEAGNLVPTFSTESPDVFVVFNGYGDLGGYAPARIMAHMAGWTYRKIGFECSPMYVNAGGYLVAPEEILGNTEDLNLSVDQHANLYEMERGSYAAAA